MWEVAHCCNHTMKKFCALPTILTQKDAQIFASGVTSGENNRHAYETGLKVAKTGEQCNNVKLTEENVIEIRRLAKTMSGLKLAKRFGVGRTCIYNIIEGRTWSWLKDPTGST